MSAHAWGDNFQRDIVNLNFARLHDCVLGHNLLTPCIVRIANDFNHQYYVVPILLFHGATHDHPMMKKVEKDGRDVSALMVSPADETDTNVSDEHLIHLVVKLADHQTGDPALDASPPDAPEVEDNVYAGRAFSNNREDHTVTIKQGWACLQEDSVSTLLRCATRLEPGIGT
ncbi:hypothetical protein BDV29DRAFT_154737 [Aspergillus leporis]|uniref:Uncharacterized protein n=1 Tax=Aspergillus leporis TaxID=41062 RepID=A0A5N5XAR0_9EURO|nr:hypothetical protein BDV29DRAFT_154737 [Aspergillus leporis]